MNKFLKTIFLGLAILFTTSIFAQTFQSGSGASTSGTTNIFTWDVINPTVAGGAGLKNVTGVDSSVIYGTSSAVNFYSTQGVYSFDGDVVPKDSGVTNLGAATAHFDTAYVDHLLGSNATIVAFVDSVTAADINALAASGSVTFTMSGSSLPTGYIISGIFLETTEAFVSATRDVFLNEAGGFIETTAPNHTIAIGTLLNQTILQGTIKAFMLPTDGTGATDMIEDGYSGGIEINFVFTGGGNNPQDFSAGILKVWLKLEKFPTSN